MSARPTTLAAATGLACAMVLTGASPAAAREVPWSADEAAVVPAHRWEVGIFAPLTYGVSERVELSTHALLDVLMPALTVKVAWADFGNMSIASEHTLAYPTPLLRTLSAKGTGGLWPDETVVPHILALHTHVLASLGVGPHARHVLTARAGALLAAQIGDSTLGTADLWFVYPRTAHWANGATLRLGLAASGPIAGDFGYAVDVDLYAILGGDFDDGSPMLEQSARVTWNVSGCVRLELGWMISGGDLPGPDDWAILPTFDARFAF